MRLTDDIAIMVKIFGNEAGDDTLTSFFLHEKNRSLKCLLCTYNVNIIFTAVYHFIGRDKMIVNHSVQFVDENRPAPTPLCAFRKMTFIFDMDILGLRKIRFQTQIQRI